MFNPVKKYRERQERIRDEEWRRLAAAHEEYKMVMAEISEARGDDPMETANYRLFGNKHAHIAGTALLCPECSKELLNPLDRYDY